MPIIGIVRGIGREDLSEILPLYKNAGLTTAEVTMNTPDAKELIRFASREYSGELNIGAGTVCSMSDLETALVSGAQFIVTPIINTDVIKECTKIDIPVFPGALTPSEIYMAWSLGAAMVKIFPAGYMGAKYIAEIKAPLDKVKMLPTGGINLNNMQSFLEAGAHGFGIGSPLFDKTMIKSKNWNALEQHFLKFIQAFTNSRKV